MPLDKGLEVLVEVCLHGVCEVFDRAAGCRLTEALVGRILTERRIEYS